MVAGSRGGAEAMGPGMGYIIGGYTGTTGEATIIPWDEERQETW